MKHIFLFAFILFACQQEEVAVKEPVGCECNDGVKLDFSKPILPGFIESDKFEAKHCDGGQYFTCGVMVFILDHKGFKRFIYDSKELQ